MSLQGKGAERWGGRNKQLLYEFTETTRYCKLKQEALDRAVWRTRSGTVYVVKHTTKWTVDKRDGIRNISNTILKIITCHMKEKLGLYSRLKFPPKKWSRQSSTTAVTVEQPTKYWRAANLVFIPLIISVLHKCLPFFPGIILPFPIPVLRFCLDLFHELPFLRARESESSQSGTGNAAHVRRLGTWSPC